MTNNDMYLIETGDVISGKQATAFIKHQGQNLPCSWFTGFEAVMNKTKVTAPRLGTASLMTRSVGWSGSGTATMYYATSFFRQMAAKYAHSGKDVIVDIVVTNDDAASQLGAQAVLFKNVSFDNITLAKFDAFEESPLTENVKFSFDDFEILSTFTHPAVPQTV